MKIKDERLFLDKDFRNGIIQEIESSENVARKLEAEKRYDVFTDNTKKYVLEKMDQESADAKTVDEIANRAANISFCRKIIDKKSLVYKEPPLRSIPGNEEETKKLELLIDMLNINSVMKKTNKFVELFRNTLVQVFPYLDPRTEKHVIKLRVLPPSQYDVIEDSDDPETMRAVIFNYFHKISAGQYKSPNESGRRDEKDIVADFREGDGINQSIADSPKDQVIARGKEQPQDEEQEKYYVWWTHNYHFTTNSKGEIVPGMQEENLRNQIGELPFIDYSRGKNGFYWAMGGDDLVDGSILLNILLTDLYYIAKFQGMGLFYLFGKGVPKQAKVGPSSAIIMEQKEGDPTPQIGFASSNPPIESHLRMIEQYLAFILSTNDIDAGAIKGSLTAENVDSGIQEIIKRSEVIEDIINQQEMYKDNEPVLYRIIAKYINLYYDLESLSKDLTKVGKIDENIRPKLSFRIPQPYMSEKEQLEVIEKRKDVGIDNEIDAIIKDNPELSREDAMALFRKKMEENLIISSLKIRNMVGKQEGQEEGEDEDGEQDNVQDQVE